MTPLPPPHTESLRFVAQASRPGSIEARLVHQCTCLPNTDRRRAWDQEQAHTWLDVIDAGCSAHGRLLERWILRGQPPLGAVPVFHGDALQVEPQHERPWFEGPKPRSWVRRVVDALDGLCRGWRGV